MSRISPSSPTANRLPQPDPLRPGAPESVLNWAELTPGEQITISGTGIGENAGEVDIVAEDGSILWVHLEAGGGRIMIHKSDKHEIWRLPAEAHATGI